MQSSRKKSVTFSQQDHLRHLAESEKRVKSQGMSKNTASSAPHEAAPSALPPPSFKGSETLAPTKLPPRRRKTRHARSGRRSLIGQISTFLSFLLVLAVAGMGALVGSEHYARRSGSLESDRVVLIPRGSSTSDIADSLQRERVIDSPTFFEVYAFTTGAARRLRAGEYVFKAHASLSEVLDTLTEGRAVLHTLSIPEGLTSEQIVTRLLENEVLTGDILDMPREGTLYPDTYKIERGMTRQELVARMQREQKRVLMEAWSRRLPELPIKTPEEMLILASIVEKETGRADERPRVAAVFINRLQRKMRLQSDPTIVYGLVGGKGTLGRGILRTEIDKVTPYNTYAIDGLPPGPIANPGKAALESVANPSRTEEVYFVADGTGGHTFSKTYDQHQRAVARWRSLEKAKREAGSDVDRFEPVVEPSRTDAVTRPQVTPSTPPTVESLDMVPVPSNRLPKTMREGTMRDGTMREGVLPVQSLTAPTVTGSVTADTPRIRTLDAVEGTKKDPLLNKTFDLNSPKTVPALRN
jgi:UPF0755 protein